jgi:energy-coupling factor transport system ATP-binding protein
VFQLATEIISLKDVSFTYKGSKRKALNGISMSVLEGECVAVLGPTGSGKSTLACIMNGTVPCFVEGELAGDVTVDGLHPREAGTAHMASRVGLVFGDPDTQLFGMTVEEDVAFGPANLGLSYEEIMRRVTRCINDMRLTGLEKRAPHRLSGGQKQATAIAGVYAMLPKIMVLDEPTSMLDPEGKAKVFSIVRALKEELGVTVILIEQEVDDIISLADRVFVMSAGSFALSGTPAEVFSEPEKLRKAGVRVPHVVEFGQLIGASSVPFSTEDVIQTIETGTWSMAAPPRDPVAGQPVGAVSEAGIEPARSASDPDPLPDPAVGEPVIEVKDLHFQYPSDAKALDGVYLTIRRGEFVAIVGQNGAGKTTLTRHLNGLLRPTSGEIRVLGRPTEGVPTTELCAHVGYVFQNPDEQLFCTTVAEELGFGPANLGVAPKIISARVEALLSDIGLAKYSDVWPKYLSKGERQRLALAAVVAMDPEVLIVDEPTTGLDWLESRQILDYLERLWRQQGKTIIIITHDMNIVSLYARRVVVMANGKVVGDGTPQQVFSQPELMAVACLRRPAIAEITDALWGEVLLTPAAAAARLYQRTSSHAEVDQS